MWNKIKDAPINVPVNVYCDNDKIYTAYFTDVQDVWIICGGGEIRANPTEWQHLPAKPNEEKILINRMKIIKYFTNYYDMSINSLSSNSDRIQERAEMRWILMAALRKYTNMSYPAIAQIVKKKDHTTIIHGIKKINTNKKLNIRFRTFEIYLLKSEGLNNEQNYK